MRRITLVLVAVLGLISIAPAANADPIAPPGFAVERISTGAFSLVQPTGLVIDQDNNIYVGRNFLSGQSDLLRIAAAGDVSSIASFGNFIGGLALDSKDQLFGSLHTEAIFRLQNGAASTFVTLPVLSVPERLVFDSQDNLFVALFAGQAISKVSPEGTATAFVKNLMGPFGVAFRGDSLLIGDNSNHGNGPGLLLEVDPSGKIVDVISPVGDRIVDLEYDPYSDSFFIADQGNSLLRVQDGVITTFAEGFARYPRDMAFDAAGNLYVVDETSLYKISPVTVEPIPEPATLTLLSLGLLILLGAGRRGRV